MFGWFKKKSTPAEPDRTTLVPRIKNLHFTAALSGMGIPAAQLPYTEPLVGDLLVAYAFDLPGAFMMASGVEIAKLGIPTDEIRSVAIASLKRQLPKLGVAEHGPVSQIVTGENLEACTLLADSFWDQVATQTEGEIIAAVPSRDVVLFCSSKSAEGIATMLEMSHEVFEGESTHGLTENLFVWRGSRWMEYKS